MNSSDRIEVHELPARYAAAIDGRAWHRLKDVFTEDAIFDMSDVGHPVAHGLAEIIEHMSRFDGHPLAHLMTNIYVDELTDGVRLSFRLLALVQGAEPHTRWYDDNVVKTAEGWRVTHRVITKERVGATDEA
jgi:SnoaL-like domain